MSNICLRIVNHNDLDETTKIIYQENLDKQKSKRGRPRKNQELLQQPLQQPLQQLQQPQQLLQQQPLQSPQQPLPQPQPQQPQPPQPPQPPQQPLQQPQQPALQQQSLQQLSQLTQKQPLEQDEPILKTTTSCDTIIIPKKRGRKKKNERLKMVDSSKQFNKAIFTKSYIVQLKIKSSDLEKIQEKFINETRISGYGQQLLDHNFPNTETIEDYSSLLNKLELPLLQNIQVAENFPNVPNLYQNIVIPILPANVPIKLFDDMKSYNNSKNDEICDTYRDTRNLLLPLLDNHGLWPEKSPYACWNCDFHFSGTPWGIPDNHKEPINDLFYGYGNFCSPECTARYISDRENTVEFWEKYSILCLIYQTVFNLPPESKVMLAPPRETLKKYGGKLSYENYHNINKQTQTVEIYKLPMVPVRLHIDEMSRSSNIDNLIQKGMNEHRVRKQKKVIPIDPIKVSQAEANIRNRALCISENKYTLDHCLQDRR